MATPRVCDLRRLYRRALLLAPLAAVACHPHDDAPPKQPATEGATASAAPIPLPPPTRAHRLPNGKSCDFEPAQQTGCGGGPAKLRDTPESCGLPTSGDLDPVTCSTICSPMEVRGCSVDGSPSEGYSVFCEVAHPCVGRRPSGGEAEGAPTGSSRATRAAYADELHDALDLARHVEARSVEAFRELAAHLARWGAPRRMVADCLVAAEDERRHARAMRGLMDRRGLRARRTAGRRGPGFRSLAALALHNEREGVVGETWGALVATHQAAHAASSDVRRAMRAVAREETRHAALSFRIARWARGLLGPNAVARLDAERRRAFAALRATGGYRPEENAARALGWPSREASRAMAAALAPVLG